MKTKNFFASSLTILLSLEILGCSKPAGTPPSAPTTPTVAALERSVYGGDLELSKNSPVSVTLDETNSCTITTMVLPGGILNLDLAVETKGATGAVPHTSVTTHVGQQFSFSAGSTTYSYTAKLKAE